MPGDSNLGEIAKIVFEYRSNETVPDEMTQAKIVSLYKRGEARVQSNFRPISVLNAIYKLYVKIIIKNIITQVIDDFITETQYGFRQSRSTAQAIHVVRRIVDYTEVGGTTMNMLLLDWEKAFG